MGEKEHNSEGHPDLAELDAFRTGEAGAGVRAHLDGCARCRDIAGELARLAPELKAAARPAVVEVPAEIDARILSAARGRARRPVPLLWPGLVAAAASLLLVAAVFWGTRARQARLAMDIDGNGSVDIVDAYLISRRVGNREAVPSSWDFDGNGEIGGADVELVARRAVALTEGGI